MSTIIESGIQLLARLADNSKKPVLELEKQLFPDGLANKHTVEISGDSGSGKTYILAQLIATCILPTEYNGFNINVLLINTDNRFPRRKLYKIMTNYVKMALIEKSELLNDTKLIEIVDVALKNLKIINCLEYYQYNCILFSLQSILNSNDKIDVVFLDSISAFYWQDREVSENEQFSLNYYVLKVLKKIQQSTFQYNVKIIFTKPADYESSKVQTLSQNATICESTLGEVNHKIHLSREINSSQRICKVDSAKGSRTINFEINDIGIKWLNSTDS